MFKLVKEIFYYPIEFHAFEKKTVYATKGNRLYKGGDPKKHPGGDFIIYLRITIGYSRFTENLHVRGRGGGVGTLKTSQNRTSYSEYMI